MRLPRLPLATRVAFFYVLIGGAWILLSDRLFAAIFSDPAELAIAQTYKGWFLVLLTGLSLLAYLGRESRRRRTSEQHLRDMSEHSPEGILQSSVDDSPFASAIESQGRLLYMNEASAKLLGLSSPRQQQEIPLADFVHHNMGTLVPDRLASIEHGRSVPPFEVKLVRRDGSSVVVEISAFPGSYRAQAAAQLFMRDLSGQKAAEDALRSNEERLRAIVDNTQNIYYSHSPDHQLTYVSPQVQLLLGYSPDELVHGWQDLATNHPINERGADLSQKAIDSGKPQEPYVLELRAKDGAHVWFEVRETPVVREGKTVAIVGALTDITERKLTDENLERRLAELTVLHSVAIAGSQSQSEDELIARTTQIVSGMLYPDDAGVYLLD